MSMILPVPNKIILISHHDFQKLIDGVRLINLSSTKKEDMLFELKSIQDNHHCLFGFHCVTCQIAFESSEEFRAHYKSDWHRYNLKQKIRNKQTIDEQKFLVLDDKFNDTSSSESEEEINAYNSHFSINSKLFFENSFGNAFSIYRCLLNNTKEVSDEKTVIQSLKSISSKSMWLIIMLGGGRFSAAIFKGEDLIVHKTFHSYTVRAKQGCSQNSQDRSKGGCKSAGASLRRYNEASQLKHIQEILTSWLHHIKVCNFIFYRAIGPHNRNILFGGSNPLINKNDSRLCQIPFGTKKATFDEVQKVHKQLSAVLVYESKDTINNSIQNYVFNLFKKKKNKEFNKNKIKTPVENNPHSNENVHKDLLLSTSSDFSKNDITNEKKRNIRK